MQHYGKIHMPYTEEIENTPSPFGTSYGIVFFKLTKNKRSRYVCRLHHVLLIQFLVFGAFRPSSKN